MMRVFGAGLARFPPPPWFAEREVLRFEYSPTRARVGPCSQEQRSQLSGANCGDDVARVKEYAIPPHSPAPCRMERLNFWVEWRVGLDLLRLARALPALFQDSRGDGAPVILIPGWKAPEVSMEPLRLFLRARGYQASHWGLGVNRGDPEKDSELLAERVVELARASGRPVGLVGWSLGGVIARETARSAPQSICVVITYGTPVVGGPTYTLAARYWGKGECERIAAKTAELDATRPIGVPILAIFTRRDEVVSWAACVDRSSARVTHVEVDSTHLGMGFSPDVWRAVQTCLQIHARSGQSLKHRPMAVEPCK